MDAANELWGFANFMLTQLTRLQNNDTPMSPQELLSQQYACTYV